MFPANQNTFPIFQNIFLPLILPISCTRKSYRNFLFCPPKLHLLIFQVKQVDVILVGKDIASVFSEILPDASVQTMPLHFG
jgi:hypothetical protein